MNKIFIFFILFCIFSTLSYALSIPSDYECISLIWNSSFPVSSLAGRWDYYNAGYCGGYGAINSRFQTYAFGQNGTGLCGTSYGYTAGKRAWQGGIPANYTSGIYRIEYNFSVIENQQPSEKIPYLTIGTQGQSFAVEIKQGGLNRVRAFPLTPNLDAFTNCDMAIEGKTNYTIEVIIDLDNKTYSVFVDGFTNSSCYNQILCNDSFTWKFDRFSLDGTSQNSGTGNVIRSWIDDFSLCRAGGSSLGSCAYPKLFCDNFDYDDSLYDKYSTGWYVYDKDYAINTFFTPTNDTLVWNGSNPAYIYHEISPFTTNYKIDAEHTITSSYYAPSFTQDFYLNMTNLSTGTFILKNFDADYDLCSLLKFEVYEDLSYYNVSFYNESNEWVFLYAPNVNLYNHIVMTSLFSSRHKTSLFGFNTSYTNNSARVFLDNIPIHFQQGLTFNPKCDSIFRTFFVMENTDSGLGFFSNATIQMDDYFMYLGTDKDVSTVEIETIDLYDEESITYANQSTETITDLADSLDGSWDSIGLISQASKIIIALLFMIVLSGAIIGLAIQNHFSGVGIPLIIVNFLCILFFTYIGFFPVWIIVTLVLVAILGIGITFFVRNAS